jgi:hypothetical protein
MLSQYLPKRRINNGFIKKLIATLLFHFYFLDCFQYTHLQVIIFLSVFNGYYLDIDVLL